MAKNENKKPWEKPWHTDEIRDHSANWNLAGDAGLLNHLQQFSQDLLKSTHATEVAIDQLVEETKTTTTQIENVTNTFLSLANTQFVENRVYDDDEKETPPEEKSIEEKVKSKEEQEAEIVDRVREALKIGMSILDTHFETVEVPASDSEDEESSASVGRLVLKARNPYTLQPLPYLIGSKEFMEDDKVGLGDISSDTEDSPDQNIVQSSESDDEMEQDEIGPPVMPKMPLYISSSDSENSEPESDRGGSVVKPKKQRTGSLTLGSVGAVEEEGDIFSRDSLPEADEVAAVKNDVTSELGAKLVGASSYEEQAEPEGNLFVVPSDPEADSLFGYTADKFKGGGGLFDDLDDWNDTSNSLWKRNEEKIRPTLPSETSQEADKYESKNKTEMPTGSSVFGGGDLFNDDKNEGDIFSSSNPSSTKRTSKSKVPSEKTSTPETVNKCLFEENEDEDDDLFGTKPKTKQSGSTQDMKGSSLFDRVVDEDYLFAGNSYVNTSEMSGAKKKPAGGVSVFDGVNLFGDISPIMQHNSSGNVHPSNTNITANSSGIATISQEQNVSQKEEAKLSLFDSADDVFFPSPVAASTMKSDLFNEVNESDSLFAKPKHDENVQNLSASVTKSSYSSLGTRAKKTVSLFDGSDSGDDELLFSSTSSTRSQSRRSQASGDMLRAPVEKKLLLKKQFGDDFFGNSATDEPGVDIFSVETSSKITNANSAHDDKSKSKGCLPATTEEAKKDAHKLFDGVHDIDDIFAVPKLSNDKTKERERGVKAMNLHGDLFASITDETDDIFSQNKSVSDHSSAVSHALPVSEVNKEDILSEHSNADSLVSEQPTHANPCMHIDILTVPELKPVVQDVKYSSSETKSAKLVVKSNESEVKSCDLAPDTSMVKDMPESSLTGSGVRSRIAGSQVTLPVSQKPKIVAKKPLFHSQDNHDTPNNDKKRPGKNRETHICGIKGELNQDSLRKDPESISKPKPPKTLNIRKTTDVLFEISSNGDEDLFDTLLSGKLSGEGSSTDQNVHHNSALSSSTLGALLEDYDTGSCSDSGPLMTDPGIYAKEGKASPKHMKSSETSPQKLSPVKFLIDPRTLLPGAKPSSQTVQSDQAVSFDKPAEAATTLQSVGKARAKIQVKRRPPSRKARQEALQASSADYDNVDAALTSQLPNSKNTYSNHLQNGSFENNNVVPENQNSDVLNTSCPRKPMFQQPSEEFGENQNVFFDISFGIKSDSSQHLPEFLDGNSNPLSPSTDEEDLFAVPQEIGGEDTNNKDPSEDGKSLFGGAPVLSPVGKEPHTSLTNEQDPVYASVAKAFDVDGRDENVTGQPVTPTDILHNVASATQLPSSNVTSGQNTTEEKSAVISKLVTNNNNSSNDDDDDDDDYDLFSSKRKPLIGGRKDKNSAIFSSEESLFPAKNSGVFVTGKTKNKLFSPSESDSDDLFSFANKSVIHKQPVTEGADKMSVKPPKIDEKDDIFALSKAQHRPLFQNTEQELANPVSNPSEPPLSVVRSQKQDTNALFGDDSPESDLFVPPAKKRTERKGANVSGARIKMSGSGSLFDDIEDDDIFSSNSIKNNKSVFGDAAKSSKADLSTRSKDAHSENIFASCPPSKISDPPSTKHQSAHCIETKEQHFEDPLMAMKK